MKKAWVVYKYQQQRQDNNMNNPQFHNSELQLNSLGDTIDLNPDDITVAYDSDLNTHILTINDVRYGYELEVDRDRDRNLAMALLLKSMQDDDGVQIRALYIGSKVPVTMGKIKVDEHGSIYVVTTDKHGDYMNIHVTDLIADGYEIPDAIADLVTLAEREDEVLTKATKHVRLGDYVETTPHGHRGRVSSIAQVFSETGESNAWFAGQSASYDEAQKCERWISILCDGSGAVLVAESRVTVVEKFDFSNPYANEYFRD
jgi:hypothetical protein